MDERELEEAGAEFDDPERIVTLDGGMDDPDGLEEPTRLARSRIEEEEGWGLDAPSAGEPESDIDADDDIDITPTGNVLHTQRAG